MKFSVDTVGRNLKKGAIVVLESTIYPGVTEEIVMPLLEKSSGMNCGVDFTIGYSPERINPGDEAHGISNITKIVSGMDEETTEVLAELYNLITTVFKARDVQTAKAVMVIENIQRDLNIALMNELALIFERMNIDIMDDIEAAATKWNFNVYYPGAGVSGHCLPVDPYFLVTKAEELRYHSKVITAGRAVNDYMPLHVFELLGSGADLSARFTCEIQDEAGGIAQALSLAEDFADDEDVAVILGDNIFQDDVKDTVQSFNSGAHIFLKAVPDAARLGLVEVDEGSGQVLCIE